LFLNAPKAGDGVPKAGDGVPKSRDSAYLSDDNTTFSGDSAYPKGDSAYPKGDNAYISGDRAYQSGDSAYPKGDSAFGMSVTQWKRKNLTLGKIGGSKIDILESSARGARPSPHAKGSGVNASHARRALVENHCPGREDTRR